MDTPSLDEIIAKSPVVVHSERFAYLQTDNPPSDGCFAVVTDADETTVIAPEKRVPDIPHQKVEKWFRLLEFQIIVPFKGVGFLATIAKTLADQEMNILICSTFSKDFFLVHEEDLETAVRALIERGFTIHQEN
ncbi:MAG: ACT domain-containing protein [Nanoarchaeota archaeon]|nr:ACT domain-containing protein [Nanoarchaeota archaeon]